MHKIEIVRSEASLEIKETAVSIYTWMERRLMSRFAGVIIVFIGLMLYHYFKPSHAELIGAAVVLTMVLIIYYLIFGNEYWGVQLDNILSRGIIKRYHHQLDVDHSGMTFQQLEDRSFSYEDIVSIEAVRLTNWRGKIYARNGDYWVVIRCKDRDIITTCYSAGSQTKAEAIAIEMREFIKRGYKQI